MVSGVKAILSETFCNYKIVMKIQEIFDLHLGFFFLIFMVFSAFFEKMSIFQRFPVYSSEIRIHTHFHQGGIFLLYNRIYI